MKPTFIEKKFENEKKKATLKKYLFIVALKNPPAMQETLVRSLGQKTRWRRERLPTPEFLGFPCGSAGKESACNARVRSLAPVFWCREFHGLYSPCDRKESNMTD